MTFKKNKGATMSYIVFLVLNSILLIANIAIVLIEDAYEKRKLANYNYYE